MKLMAPSLLFLSLFSTSASNRVWGALTLNLRSVVEADLFQGVTVLLLAALALGALRRPSPTRRIVLGYVVLAVCAWGIALGPEVRLFGSTLFAGPFAWLREVGVFRMIRVPARASVFLGLALSMLAAFGLDGLRRTGWRVALVGLALIEATVAPLRVVAADRCIRAAEPVPPVYLWLGARPGDEAAIELPILPNDGLFHRPRFDDSVYLLRSTLHWKRLVNGYAGTEPKTYGRVREAMEDFPSPESIALLRSMNVRDVIVHLRGFGPNRRETIEERLPRFSLDLREASRFADDLALEIVPKPVSESPGSGPRPQAPSPSEASSVSATEPPARQPGQRAVWAGAEERPDRWEAASSLPSRNR